MSATPAFRFFAVCASLSAATGLGACGAPGSVEGVFSGDGFRLECEAPLAKSLASGRDSVIVLAEYDSETLRTVTVRLPRTAELPRGEGIDVGPDTSPDLRPAVEVIVGDLVVDTRADGVEIISSENAVRATSVSGSLTLDEQAADAAAQAVPELAGRFLVDLDDGGYLEGAFVATLAE